MFSGRKLLIATRHDKHSVIAPLVERELGFSCMVLPDLDTDSLGTFSGEVERIDDPVTTAGISVAWACSWRNAMPRSQAKALSDRILPFRSCRWTKNSSCSWTGGSGLEIHVSEMRSGNEFQWFRHLCERRAREVCQSRLFPSHGLIIRGGQHDFRDMKKGITDWDTLLGEFERMREQYGRPMWKQTCGPFTTRHAWPSSNERRKSW